MPRWADLNKRQQKYLQEIYNQDQENERYERGIANCFVSDFCNYSGGLGSCGISAQFGRVAT
jgi:hypothetical protein